MSAQSADERHFDLTGVESSDHSRMRSTFLLIRLILVALLAFGGAGMPFVVPRLIRDFPRLVMQPDGPWLLALFVTVVLYLGLVATLLVQSARHHGRGPVRADVGRDGFRLSWSDGCYRSWTWDDLRGSVRLTDLREGVSGYEASIQLSMAFCGALSGEAYDAIVLSARARGLTVRSSDFPGSPYMGKHRTVVIRRDSLQQILFRKLVTE